MGRDARYLCLLYTSDAFILHSEDPVLAGSTAGGSQVVGRLVYGLVGVELIGVGVRYGGLVVLYLVMNADLGGHHLLQFLLKAVGV